MNKILLALFMAVIAAGTSACGHKGKLKTPSQIEAAKAKDAGEPAPDDDLGEIQDGELDVELEDLPNE